MINPTYLGGGVKMTPSAINAFVTQKIEKKKFKKTTNLVIFLVQTPKIVYDISWYVRKIMRCPVSSIPFRNTFR